MLTVIKQAKTSKTPGPDGFSAAYYKKFATQFVHHLLQFFTAIRDGATLDADSNKANICLIPKPDKDHTDVANYRPISLINNNLKLLTKIYANRFNTFLTQYIHIDQVRFVQGRQAVDQITRAIDLVSIIRSNWDGGDDRRGMLLSLDLHKAFDSISWPFLCHILQKWNCGQNFHGIESVGKTHKCGLFVDDMLLFISDPIVTLPNLFALMFDYFWTEGKPIKIGGSKYKYPGNSFRLYTTILFIQMVYAGAPVSWS